MLITWLRQARGILRPHGEPACGKSEVDSIFLDEAEQKPHRSVKRAFWCVVWAHGGGCSAAGIWEQIQLEGEPIHAMRGQHEHIRHFLLKVTNSTSK